jgi:predicted permease
VGLSLRFKLSKEEIKPFLTALGVKMIASPIIAFGVVFVFGWDALAADVAILEAAMGPMITAGALATMVGLAPRLSASIVGYGTLITFGSTWIVMQLL